MKQFICLLSFFFFCTTLFSQELTEPELLDKEIAYQDPNGNWSNFNRKLFVNMETPEKPAR